MFSDRLKKLRKEAKLTQTEVAKQLNISQQAYQAWESGRRNPKKETIQMFADFFNVSYAYITGETDIKNSSELSDTDITELLNNGTVSYDGKPMTDHDKEVLTQVIKDYFDGKLEDYDW